MTRTSFAYRLDQVTHFFGDKKVIDIKHLEIPKGSITGLMGPNGSGKTTLLKLLAFAIPPSSGCIFFNGRPEYPFSPKIRSKVTLVTQKPYLLKRSVFDNIAYGLKIRQDIKDLKQRVCRALDSVGLAFDQFAFRQWHELSGGEAQRVALAARLILKPEVLLLDEPVASVDTRSAALIRTASLAARRDWGTTLVIASHDLAWLFDCSDTQISISSGTLFATGREIIIPGPYIPPEHPGQAWTKQLEDGQTILLPARSGAAKTAVIRQENICLGTTGETSHEIDNRIKGQVQSMHLTGQNRQIMATIAMGEMSVMLGTATDQAAAMGLQPGTQITLLFCSCDIIWR
ncbi:MAG: energy-coupling factor ABC transporter ATP-binding protein [Desulfotignum sp.]|nr:energy-coupling factor ABC transporter ATP-binding protein [Desulfotignum sp.]